jgi:hypothetical protein
LNPWTAIGWYRFFSRSFPGLLECQQRCEQCAQPVDLFHDGAEVLSTHIIPDDAPLQILDGELNTVQRVAYLVRNSGREAANGAQAVLAPQGQSPVLTRLGHAVDRVQRFNLLMRKGKHEVIGKSLQVAAVWLSTCRHLIQRRQIGI